VGRAARITPFTEKGDGNVWKLTLPACVFPVYRNDGMPSHVATLLPQHPIAAGLPAQWDIPRTEMYGEPFHVPPPDEVVFEEKWDKGEHFRSGCVWQVGKGRVFYFPPRPRDLSHFPASRAAACRRKRRAVDGCEMNDAGVPIQTLWKSPLMRLCVAAPLASTRWWSRCGLMLPILLAAPFCFAQAHPPITQAAEVPRFNAGAGRRSTARKGSWRGELAGQQSVIEHPVCRRVGGTGLRQKVDDPEMTRAPTLGNPSSWASLVPGDVVEVDGVTSIGGHTPDRFEML